MIKLQYCLSSDIINLIVLSFVQFVIITERLKVNLLTHILFVKLVNYKHYYFSFL